MTAKGTAWPTGSAGTTRGADWRVPVPAPVMEVGDGRGSPSLTATAQTAATLAVRQDRVIVIACPAGTRAAPFSAASIASTARSGRPDRFASVSCRTRAPSVWVRRRYRQAARLPGQARESHSEFPVTSG